MNVKDNCGIKGALSSYLGEELLKSFGREAFQEDVGILSDGLIDSLGMLRLTAFIEDTFDVVVDLEEIDESNFDNVELMSAYISQKMAS